MTALACEDVTVTYGDVVALRNISVAFDRGRIHAVVGQNGAGKTTFARVCAGIVRPSSGQLTIGDRPVPVGDVGASRLSGVELVHQSFALPPSFTVAEAMEFGSTRHTAPIYSRRGLEARWRGHLESLDVRARLADRVRDLPVETQQGVEIARALVNDARVLILDEPTAVLAPPAIEMLFARLRRLQQNGVTVLLILHKIREVLAIAETITVLRAGQLVAANLPVDALGPADLAHAIVGSIAVDAAASSALRAVLPSAATAAMRLTAVTTRRAGAATALDAVDLSVQRAEIVGIAGVEGNGQSALADALAGVTAYTGTIELDGVTLASAVTPAARLAAGVRVIPQDRRNEALVLGWSVAENDDRAEATATQEVIERFDVRPPDPRALVDALSGGNQQKIVVGRALGAHPKLLVAYQPTRGIDVGAATLVQSRLIEARNAGVAVLLISFELDEIFALADRVLVMCGGRFVGAFDRANVDRGRVGALMAGAH
jgi:simple sugar transport system ATP-binding protein